MSVIHIDELPAGWLGKTHALQAGAASVDPSCEWLLFTDADVVFAPDTLRRALALAQRDHLDLMAAAPDIVTVSLAERIFIAFFSMIFALAVPPWRVNDPRSRAAVGVGAFNLVRRSTFRDVGGLSHIALSVDDDVRFAQAVKFAGYRCALVSGTRALAVRWHVGMLGMIRGLEKNFFGACDYRLVTALAGAAGFLMLGVLPFLGLLVGPWWMRLFCAIGIGAIALMIQGARGLDGLAWYHALGFPVASVALIFALLRSTVLTYVRGGVRWRDHLYPLPLLRDHCRRRNAWLRELWLSTR
ncbi:MAG: glycosyltransferase [Isosphaeraceae bacterium]